MTRLFQRLVAGLLAALVAGQAAAGPDDRYVVIGGAVAEIFDALAPEGQVAGIGAGIPAQGRFADVPVVRGFRLTSAENLLSLRPTVVLIAARQTTPELLAQLATVPGVQVEMFPDTRTPDDVAARIARLGQILDRETAATALAAELRRDWQAAIDENLGRNPRPRGLFVLSGGGRGNLAGGHDTFAAQLIAWAGGENLTTMVTGHRPLSQEAMVAMGPAFIMTNAEGMIPEAGTPPLLGAPGIQQTPAFRNNALFAVPSGMLTEAGLQTPAAIRFLAGEFRRLGLAP